LRPSILPLQTTTMSLRNSVLHNRIVYATSTRPRRKGSIRDVPRCQRRAIRVIHEGRVMSMRRRDNTARTVSQETREEVDMLRSQVGLIRSDNTQKLACGCRTTTERPVVSSRFMANHHQSVLSSLSYRPTNHHLKKGKDKIKPRTNKTAFVHSRKLILH
jgi:hypothetical protein